MKRWCTVAALGAALAVVASCGDGKKTPSHSAPNTKPASSAADDEPSAVAPAKELNLRALVHAPGGANRSQMLRLLTAQGQSRRWAPFALAEGCTRDSAEETLSYLIGAVSAWMTDPTPPEAEHLRVAAWAMGVCAAPGTEDALRAWLAPDPDAAGADLVDAAVFGLGALADRKGTLSERTQTALLDAAAREKKSNHLFPLGRIGRLSEAVGAHILEVTGNLLTNDKDPGRRHAIFALGSAGASAASPLAQVLLAESFSPQERAAAAQALSRLGGAGQDALDTTLRDMLSRGLPVEFDRELWVPLRAVVDGLEVAHASRKQLAKLSTVVLSAGEERAVVAQRRRMVWLRCQAARLLAKTKYESAELLACDPDQGRDFQLAQIQVLGRSELKGARRKKFDEFVASDDPVVVQAALRLLVSHTEIADSAKILQTALRAASPGTQATAGQIIAAYPSRAHEGADAEGPHEEIIKRLKELLTATDDKDTVPAETRAAAVKAAGALRALSLKPEVEALCSGTVPALWRPAEQALSLLGTPDKSCPPDPPELAANTKLFSQKATIVVDSDVGQLTLHVDGSDAPASAAHFLAHVDAGFYDGLAVHGARAGFAVQFGDKDGDGYQDAPSKPLPHEVSPRLFDAGTFGMSAFSPGSQDAQIFVLVSDAPQLHGTRVHLGRAEGPWHLLTVGDVLHSLKRK